MTYENFRDLLFARAKAAGFSDYELYYNAGTSFSVRVFKGEIDEYKNTESVGINFRGTIDGKMGYAYSERMDESVIEPLLKNAASNARIIEEEEQEKLYPGDKEYPKMDSQYNPKLDETSAAEKIAWALEMEKYAAGLDPRIKMINHCGIGNGESIMRIANSHGLDLSHRSNMASAALVALVEDVDGKVKNGYDYWNGRDFAEYDLQKIGRKAVDEALSYLGASSLESGAYPVILNNRMACDLFGTFAGIFNAESAQKGFSLLGKSKIGETIAAPHITLRDDAYYPGSLGGIPFDSEGVATQQKALIENGVLVNMLYNTKSAAKDGVKSTGNGFGRPLGTGRTHFYLVPGQTSYDELLKKAGRAVLVTSMGGLHSGTNTVSGDFSVSAEGFLVEDGSIVRPLEQITVAGNFYQVLKNIDVVGSDLRFPHPGGSGGTGMPSLLVHGLAISGL